MSGTSVDSVDAALVDITGDHCRYLGGASISYTDETRESLSALNNHPSISLSHYIQLDHEVACVFAEAAILLLNKTNRTANDIVAIGSHGQTIYHQPNTHPTGTIQIGDPNRIAALTGIDVVADFRRADMARNGQGAPLVPAFHHYTLSDNTSTRVILNLGGIANISILGKAVSGFDTGPANTLLDAWCQHSTGERFDKEGEWGRQGKVHGELLKKMLNDDFFQRIPPKSTGKDYFNLSWLKQYCGDTQADAQNIQTTLVDLTAASVANAIKQYAPSANTIFACGGGVKNRHLMERLAHFLQPNSLGLTSDLGIDCEACEAMAFAWLARRFKNNLPGNLPGVTGTDAPAVLGGFYPGRKIDPHNSQ